MNVCKTVATLSIAVALGALGVGGAAAAGKHKEVHATASAAMSPEDAMQSLWQQHKDEGWRHNYQSWCDVDPNCNGWNEKLQAVEGKK
jgi:hypothetical protein